jgi:hypothetical protein
MSGKGGSYVICNVGAADVNLKVSRRVRTMLAMLRTRETLHVMQCKDKIVECR